MSTEISPENEQFIQHAVTSGLFQDRGQALDEAVRLLKRRVDLLRHVDEGTRQLRNGEYTEYHEEDLRKFFDEVQAQGRQRYESSKKRP
ncbi:MAG: hypothetical protein A2V98_04335 [Planctomycetes bacterium RBG_16_64_12]|nr:MAG: hypothetical protein A2V98_04335 [Planctomycetes bacterium RBG_16_64_12]